jgi:hypothetical protein
MTDSIMFWNTLLLLWILSADSVFWLAGVILRRLTGR